jgi:hypothetical protein
MQLVSKSVFQHPNAIADIFKHLHKNTSMQQHEKFTNLITKENQREKGKAR